MTSEPRIDHPIGLLFQVVGTEVNGTNSTPGLRKVPAGRGREYQAFKRSQARAWQGRARPDPRVRLVRAVGKVSAGEDNGKPLTFSWPEKEV